MLHAATTPAALASAVGVDLKSVHRWLTEGRLPYPVTRAKVAKVLCQEESFLWPQLLESPAASDEAMAELTRIWPRRSAVTTATWHALFSSATRQLDLLVVSGGFLIETLDLAEVIRWRAGEGAVVRLLVADPSSPAVDRRAAEVGLPWLSGRCATMLRYLSEVDGLDGVTLRSHSTTVHASLFRFDDLLLVNTSAFGVWACHSPVLQLQRAFSGLLFDFHSSAFERVWAAS